jgi:hypothetical protein
MAALARPPFVDRDTLMRVLRHAARAGRPVTYGQVLAYFGKQVGSANVAALCRELGPICERNRRAGEPELAVLVVRKADGLPGEGFFTALRNRGDYHGPSDGAQAHAFVQAEQARVFAHFAALPAGPGDFEEPKLGRD